MKVVSWMQNLNAWGGDIRDGCEVRTFEWKGKNDKNNMMWGFFPLDDPERPVDPMMPLTATVMPGIVAAS